MPYFGKGPSKDGDVIQEIVDGEEDESEPVEISDDQSANEVQVETDKNEKKEVKEQKAYSAVINVDINDESDDAIEMSYENLAFQITKTIGLHAFDEYLDDGDNWKMTDEGVEVNKTSLEEEEELIKLKSPLE